MLFISYLGRDSNLMEKLTYHLILGSNLGDRLQQLAAAKKLLSDQAGSLEGESNIYETQPWGYDDQPWFLNQVVALRSSLSPDELITLLKSIEKQLGRQPGEKWHARHIDIDILLCGAKVIHHPSVTIPHPFLQDRNFVLIPLMDLVPHLKHPVLHKTIEELYLESRDTGEVYIFNADEQGNPL
jgi:2-amino-4-hydroxy-6-hydroxymethyldihydropteridine diphosphokinase